MRFTIKILLTACVWLFGVVQNILLAKPSTKDTLSKEEKQQFLYYFYEAQRLIRTNHVDDAKPLVEFCYELNPDDATINNYMGLYAQKNNQEDQVLAFFKRAYELNPNEYWYNYNILLMQDNDKKIRKIAIKNLESIGKQNPKDAELYDVLQKAYLVTHEYKKALIIQNNIDSIHGYNAMSAMQRYRLNALMKNNQQAIYEIERYLEIEPENYQFQMFRMQLYEQTQQPPIKMIAAYEAILKMDPRNIVVMNNLAWNLCISGGDLNRAEQLSRITIMREPSNPIYLDTYGWIMYNMGDCESAKFYIKRAIENSTENINKEIMSHYKIIEKKCK